MGKKTKFRVVPMGVFQLLLKLLVTLIRSYAFPWISPSWLCSSGLLLTIHVSALYPFRDNRIAILLVAFRLLSCGLLTLSWL